MLKLNLYAKISLLLLTVVSIPTIFLGYLSFNKSSEQIQTVTNAFLLDNLQHNAQRVDSLMSRIKQQSEKVIESEELKALLKAPPPQGQLQEFDFIRQINPLVDVLKGDYELNIYPKEPRLFPNYSSMVRGDEEWFLHAFQMEGRGFWVVRTLESSGGRPAELLYVRAIRDFPQLQPLGVLTLKVPSYLLANQLIIPERVGQLSFVMVNEAGQIIASKTNSKEDDVRYSLSLKERAPSQAVYQIKIGGTDYYEAVKSLQTEGWLLIAVIPVSELMGPVDNIKQFTWILVISGITVMSVLLLIIIRKVTVPIKTLVKHMRKILVGEPAYFNEYVRRNDEIGQLIRGYNTMITGMIDHIDKTKQYEEERSRLEMRTLIHQMNPHFLYNTMDTIKWKAEKAGEPAIVDMVTSLSNLLRFSINNGEELTTVEREMEHVKNYLSIELQRNQDAFSVYFQIQPNILHVPFMKLTVQPIVENAVKHAMKKLPETSSGKIIVSMFRSPNGLTCSVEDNGAGSSQALQEHFALLEKNGGNQDSGVGLYNVDRRLKLRFGAEYGITLENRPEGGCKVTLVHPIVAHEVATTSSGDEELNKAR
jgi:two-component system sensor histidine kinase YesM